MAEPNTEVPLGLIQALDEWGRKRRLKDHGIRTIEHLRRWALVKRNPWTK